MGVACLEFRGENFCGWLKNREIRESFLPRKFPDIRYLAFQCRKGQPNVSLENRSRKVQGMNYMIKKIHFHSGHSSTYCHTNMWAHVIS